MENKEIEQAVQQAAQQGKLTCAAAWKLAEELEVEFADVGKAANTVKVRIIQCQLGCF